MRQLAAEFLALAERQLTPVPRMVGHRNMGVSLLHIGEFEESLHFDRAMGSMIPLSIDISDAIWPRRQGGNLILSVAGALGDGLSREGPCRR